MAKIIGQGWRECLNRLESLRKRFAMASGVLDYFYPENSNTLTLKRLGLHPLIAATLLTTVYYASTAHEDIDKVRTPDNTVIVQANMSGGTHTYAIIHDVNAKNGNKVRIYVGSQDELTLEDNPLVAPRIISALERAINDHPETVRDVTGRLSPAISHVRGTLRELKAPEVFQLSPDSIARTASMLTYAELTMRTEGYQPNDEIGRYSLPLVFWVSAFGFVGLCFLCIIPSIALIRPLQKEIRKLEGRMEEMRKTSPVAHRGFGGGPLVSPLFRAGTDPLLERMDPARLVLRLAPSNVSVVHPPQQP